MAVVFRSLVCAVLYRPLPLPTCLLPSSSFILICNFFTLYYLLDMFANYPDAIGKWAGTLGLAFAQSWLVQDVIVILVRNNLACTKTIVRSWKYAAASTACSPPPDTR